MKVFVTFLILMLLSGCHDESRWHYPDTVIGDEWMFTKVSDRDGTALYETPNGEVMVECVTRENGPSCRVVHDAMDESVPGRDV